MAKAKQVNSNMIGFNMLNAIKELTPVIKTLEESDDNYQYDVLKDKFNLLFENL